MSPVESGLRRILLAGLAASCLGVLLELLLAEHTGSPIQLLPVVLSGLGLLGALLFLLHPAPGPRLLRGLQGLSALLALGGLLGIWEHAEHNYAFEAEIRPSAPMTTLLVEAIFGASPLLAPGALVVAGLLAFGFAWRHPAR